MNISKNVVVGLLYHTNYTSNSVVGTDMIMSLCFYRNKCVYGNEVSYADVYGIEYGTMDISAELIKTLYNEGNERVCRKINEMCRKGYYRDMFIGDEWYIGMALGGR
jgi:hypothetical protein